MHYLLTPFGEHFESGSEATKKLETLRRAADVLHDFHAAMRGELTGGW
jgi:hypothetical protein